MYFYILISLVLNVINKSWFQIHVKNQKLLTIKLFQCFGFWSNYFQYFIFQLRTNRYLICFDVLILGFDILFLIFYYQFDLLKFNQM